jgi:hypothetical protein
VGTRLISRRASRIINILETIVSGKVREIAIALEVGDSVLYHSLLGLASPQQTTRSIVRDGKYWLKWIAAQWHSWTLGRLSGPMKSFLLQTAGFAAHLSRS